LRVTDSFLTPAEVHQKLLDPNPFVPVRDFNSNLDYTELKDGRMRVIASKKVFFPQNNFDDSSAPREQMNRSITIPVKLNDVLRFDSNGDAQPENVRYFVIITADNGNCGGSTSSVVGCAVPTMNSGMEFKLHQRFWYVDN